MKLIDLLVQELPKRGGWPEGVVHAWCDRDGEIRFRNGRCKPDFYPLSKVDVEDRIPSSDYEDDVAYIVTREQYEAAIAASEQVEWDGEGLPPVGCECEFKWDGGDWKEGKITYISNHTILIELKEAGEDGDFEPAFSHDGMQFRPIRTEAECKREQIAQEMCNLFGNGIKIDEKHGYGTTWLEVYDAIAAGKIPGVKLAD